MSPPRQHRPFPSRTAPTRLPDLAPGLKNLLLEMRRIDFGTIQNLRVQRGLPVYDPATVVVRTHKPSADPHPTLGYSDAFELKREVTQFIDALRTVDNGVVPVIVIHKGLPISWETRETLSL